MVKEESFSLRLVSTCAPWQRPTYIKGDMWLSWTTKAHTSELHDEEFGSEFSVRVNWEISKEKEVT